jgi:hypothetical protein
MIRSRPAAQGPNDGRLESAHSATYPGARTFECPRFRTPLRHDPRIARRRNRASVEIPCVGCASRMFIKTMRTQSFGGGFRSGLSCADIGNLKSIFKPGFAARFPKNARSQAITLLWGILRVARNPNARAWAHTTRLSRLISILCVMARLPRLAPVRKWRAGSISKSISAYDMAVSDAIYGRCKRYVSRGRLKPCSTMSTVSTWSVW